MARNFDDRDENQKWRRDSKNDRSRSRDSKEWDDLAGPEEWRRNTSRAQDRNSRNSNWHFQDELKKLLLEQGKGSRRASEQLLDCAGDTRTIGDALLRLTRKISDDTDPVTNPFRDTARELLLRFLGCSGPAAPRDVAHALRGASFFRITDDMILGPLKTKLKHFNRVSSEFDLCLAIAGLADSARGGALVRPEVTALCDTFASRFKSDVVSRNFRVTELLKVLLKWGLQHDELMHQISEHLFDRSCSGSKDRFEALSLNDQVVAFKSYVLLGAPFPERHIALLTNSVRRHAIHNPSELDISVIATYMAAAAGAQYQLRSQVFKRLEELFHEKVEHLPQGRTYNRVMQDALLGFMLLTDEPSDKTVQLYENPPDVLFSSNLVSASELRIKKMLPRLSVKSFVHQARVGMFPLDFLVTRHDEKLVNLECDGERFHLMYDVVLQKLTPQYLGRDILRDRLLRKQGYLVARILTGEMGGKKHLQGLVTSKIRDAT